MKRLAAAAATAAALATGSAAQGGTLVSEKKSTPYPGVELTERVESNPVNRIYVAKIALCSSYIHIAATKAPSTLRTPGSWAATEGVQVAANGDFYSGTQVYGDAVGGGVPWPFAQTGKGQTGSWYHNRYGWIAFGPDWVEFNHTKQTKTVDAAKFGISLGWKPTEVTQEIPKGTVALVSGFPELVIEGQVVTCSSPTSTSCFPDRSDMHLARHPRTAMGITADRKTFLLVAVDGRNPGVSSGMYGAELAELMGKLGAWEAFNLDGGGSTALWLKSQGYVNGASSNNYGNGPRAVANHWGVNAGSASGKPAAPGSCFVPGGCFPTPLPGAENETFKDMPPGSFGHDEAIALFDAKVTNGCQTTPARLFCPSCELTRAQAVTFLVRAGGISTASPPATPSFTDVPTTHTFYAPIEAAVKAGITKGCSATQFCPDNLVTRAQLAAFITRTTGWPLVNPTTPTFPVDVPTSHTFYKDIETLSDKCVTNGCGTNKYCPDDSVTRAQAAIFIARAFDLNNANPCLGSGGGSGGTPSSGGAPGSGGTSAGGGLPGAGGLAGAAGAGAGGGWPGGAAGSLTGTGGGGGGAGAAAAEDDSGGCACRTDAGRTRRGAWALFAVAGLLLWRKRRHG